MRFSWTGMILAPLPLPLIFSILFWSPSAPILSFLFPMILGCVISYGTTMLLFLPALFLLSVWRPLTTLNVCLLGLVLGAAVYVPVTLMFWMGSGPDSGPPAENFLVFFVRWVADPLTAVFPLAGLMTAGLYWWLGTWRRNGVARSFPSAQ
jgi:hypothetical protein